MLIYDLLDTDINMILNTYSNTHLKPRSDILFLVSDLLHPDINTIFNTDT